jgi:hydroxymethylpyrimidine/phosphomethylpyrimidine kinase
VSAVLVIAGADSSGGAGISRDLHTLTRLNVRALCAVTAVTAQSDNRLIAVHVVPAQLVRAQIEAAFITCDIGAIKIGMLADAVTVRAVAESVGARAPLPVVLDPVLRASAGGELLDAAGLVALRELLLPRVTLVTPNVAEAALLTGACLARTQQELERQGQRLLAYGAHAVLLKGGHAAGAHATDVLLQPQCAPQRFSTPRYEVTQRGTGCALASAIAAALAQGADLAQACARGKHYMDEWLRP